MTLTLKEAKAFRWGTFGKDAVEDHAIHDKPLPELEIKRLGDLSDDHLKRILFNQKQIGNEYQKAIRMILRARHRLATVHGSQGESFDAEEGRHKIRRREAVEATKAKLK